MSAMYSLTKLEDDLTSKRLASNSHFYFHIFVFVYCIPILINKTARFMSVVL